MRESFPDSVAGPPTPAPRFSWPMRIFLSFLLFDIIFHSFVCLIPYREWMEEKDMPRFPERLPTWQEVQETEEDAVTERFLQTLDSTWDYFRPWPGKKTRAKMEGWQDHSMYVLSWITSRLDFFEHLAGVPQRWTMFSPNASREATVGRFRLEYSDGTTQVVRLTADPEDLTHYSHWWEEKVLDAELKVAHDYDSRLGYCNYLAHQHRRNRAGAALEKIHIYKITYRYPRPDEDVFEVFKAQSGPPSWDRDGPHYSYEADSGKIRKLKDHERKQTQARLDQMPSQAR